MHVESYQKDMHLEAPKYLSFALMYSCNFFRF